LPYDFLYDISRLPKSFFKELVRVAYNSGLHRKAGTVARSLISMFKIEKITGLNINNAISLIEDLIDIESANLLFRDDFKNAKRKVLLLPHCFKPGTLVSSNPIPQRIENVDISSPILGKSGLTNVKYSFTRYYRGELIKINFKGYPVYVTPEHPILVAELNKCKWYSSMICRPNCGMKKYGCSATPVVKLKWKKAKDIKRRDYLLIPRIKTSKQNKLLIKRSRLSQKRVPKEIPFSKALFEIFGWYLAEGDYNKGQIRFSLGHDEGKKAEHLRNLLEDVFKIPAYIRKEPTTLVVSINSSELVENVFKHFGANAKEKVIPEFVMRAPLPLLKVFLKAYCEGDGYKNLNNKSAQISSSSEKVIFQLMLLAARLGINFSVTYGRKAKGRLHGRSISGYVHRIDFYGKGANIFFPYKASKSRTSIFYDEDFAYYPVTSVTKVQYSGQVHNLETEDNTYCVPFIVHNCARKYMDSRCKASFDPSIPSYFCNKCSKDCLINKASQIGLELGYDVYVIPGGSCVEKILRRGYDAVVGVACRMELKLGLRIIKKLGIPGQGLFLLKNGCANTKFDIEQLEKILKGGENFRGKTGVRNSVD